MRRHRCTVWWTWFAPGVGLMGAAYCKRYGWHAVGPLRKGRKAHRRTDRQRRGGRYRSPRGESMTTGETRTRTRLKKRFACDMIDRCATLHNLLSLVMRNPPPVTRIRLWSGDQREHAEEWAAREHLNASDNLSHRIEVPSFLNRGDV